MKKVVFLLLLMAISIISVSSLADSSILVAYFSCTGNTKPLAEYAAEILNADLYEIVAEQPYTEADLAYYTGARCDQEQADPDARPVISGSVKEISQYDTVIIAHPIWHGQAPRIIDTFLESYDFSGKTLTTMCTSHSSPIGSSAENLKKLVKDVTWLDSRRFAAGSSKEEVQAWLDSIGLIKESDVSERIKIKITVNDKERTATLSDNASAMAFADFLKRGPVTIDMHDYGDFEKVGPLGTTIVRCDEKITTVPGDIILYLGNNVTIYYGQNTYSFTLLGHIDDATAEDMKEFLGEGNPTAVFSLIEDHEPVSDGWFQDGDRWQYYLDGAPVANDWICDNEIWYRFDASGIMETGWQQIDGIWYYFDHSGAMVTGWQFVNRTWYYFKPSGAMASGWISDAGKWYYFDSSGAMVTGWAFVSGTWYYFKPSGAMASGWMSDAGEWYYFDSSGAMVTGWRSVGGAWYYFKDSGAMVTGWLEDKKAEAELPADQKKARWYWFGSNGKMATGWQLINDRWEMFDESGLWLYTWDGN